MTVQEMLDVLNNRDEIPDPSKAELCFYLEGKDYKDEPSLRLTSIGAFDISTDITVGFKFEDETDD
jgi:hypothetical protein